MRSVSSRFQVRGALIVGSLLVAVPGLGLQGLQPRSLADLSPDDRSAITELAQKAGIDGPQLVAAYNFIDADDLCRAVKVESRPIVNGRRVISRQLWLRRDTGVGCARWPIPPNSIRHKNWLTGGVSYQIVSWRFTDGNWFVDVFFQNQVPYEDAAAIVRAIRHRELVDRRSPDQIQRQPSSGLDASRIITIGRIGSGAKAGRGRAYSVDFSNHDAINVTVTGAVVELHEWVMWAS